MGPSLEDTHLLTSPFNIPNQDIPISDILSRWSESHVLHPAIIIVPRTEQDILSAILFARRNNLRVLVASGGHGASVPVDPRTLYLDMKSFKTVDVHPGEQTVEVGGGVLTGELIRELSSRGFYTGVVNSNAVGVVGALLGGGNTSQNGLLGWASDNVLSFRIITAEAASPLQVSSSSASPDELSLFHALCGAGHGLGVITSVTLRVYPVSNLDVTDGGPSVWTRTLVLPPSAIDLAAKALLSLQPPPKPMNIILGFARSPVNGSPVLILTSTYYGPSSEAEPQATSAGLFSPLLLSLALQSSTTLTPLSQINDAVEPVNTPGGYKTMVASRIRSLSPETTTLLFNLWLSTTENHPLSRRSTVFLHNFNPEKLIQGGETAHPSRGLFVEARDRGLSAIFSATCQDEATSRALEPYLDEMLSLSRRDDDPAVDPPRGFPNAMKRGADLGELFVDETLEELARVKKRWDPEGLFWSPFER